VSSLRAKVNDDGDVEDEVDGVDEADDVVHRNRREVRKNPRLKKEQNDREQQKKLCVFSYQNRGKHIFSLLF
jgi:hypothetical protein